jgi:hypothetical protein
VRTRHLPIAVLATVLLAVALGGCRDEAPVELEPPATKVEIEGTDRYQVILTEKAAERLDIQTTEVSEVEGGLMVPSDALILDTDGVYWVYVNPEPLTYERAVVTPVREADGEAFFTDGPAPGTPIVVVGVPELYGEETGVGK